MSKVYFKKIEDLDEDIIHNTIIEILEKIVKEENIKLEKKVPIKVHFGEKGNATFIKPVYYSGIREYLKNNNINSLYIETNVLYKGSRTKTSDHINTALEHGFNDLDIVIADDNHEYNEIEVNLKNFKSCKIGKKYMDYDNFIIASHFKGHELVGIGGAIKQLGMGFASRGGKLHQHSNSMPLIKKDKCIRCSNCVKKCPVDAITIYDKATIDKEKCIGCASCTSVCPVNAITNSWDGTNFHERLAEYAYAASKNKVNIYINFAFNITEACDCVGNEMPVICPNIGLFISIDPVSIDMACLDKLKEIKNNEFMIERGLEVINYATNIGLGDKNYQLIEI